MSPQDDKTRKQEATTSLADRIAEAENRKSKLQEKAAKAQMPAEGMALAGRVATELVAGIVVGGMAAGYFEEHKSGKDAESSSAKK